MITLFLMVFLGFSGTSFAYNTLADAVGDSSFYQPLVFAGDHVISYGTGGLSFRDVGTDKVVVHEASASWRMTKVGKKLVDCHNVTGDTKSRIRIFSVAGELEIEHVVPFLCQISHTWGRILPVVIENTIIGPVFRAPPERFLDFELIGFLTVNVDTGSYSFREVLHEVGYDARCFRAIGSSLMAHVQVAPGVGNVEGIRPTLYDHVRGITLTGEVVKGEDMISSFENKGHWFLRSYIRDPNLEDFELSYIFDDQMKLRKTLPTVAADYDDNYASVIATDWGWIYLNKGVMRTMTLDGVDLAEMKQNETGFFAVDEAQGPNSLRHNDLGGNFATFKRSIGSECFDKLVLMDSLLRAVKERVLPCVGQKSNPKALHVTSKGTILSGDENGLFILDKNLEEIWRQDIPSVFGGITMLENELGDLVVRYYKVSDKKIHEMTVLY